jgi:hypothetical protein
MASSQRSLDIDIVTLRRIYARDTCNKAIQSNYALLADGKGGTYWSTVVTSGGGSVNSFSTIISSNFSSVNLTALSNFYTSNIRPLPGQTVLNLIATNITASGNLTAQGNVSANNNIYSQNAFFNTLQVTSGIQITSLNVCNIFINNNGQNLASYDNLQNISGEFVFRPASNIMGAYCFIRSPSNVSIIPPSIGITISGSLTSNTIVPSQGNFFVVKNMGPANINVSQSNYDIFPVTVIPATSATFFYPGGPFSYWTVM